MSSAFDAYKELLNITSTDRPPDHYALLGLERFEGDRTRIDDAAGERMTLLQELANSEYMDASQQLLNEVSAARRCLLDPTKKIAYDEELRTRQRRAATAGTSSSAVRSSGRRGQAKESAGQDSESRTTGKNSKARALKPALPIGVAAAVAAILAIALFISRQPPSATGNVSVDWAQNEREGAVILLDDMPVEFPDTQPILLNVPPGRHRLKFTRSGYNDIPKTVNIQNKRIHIVLTWAPVRK